MRWVTCVSGKEGRSPQDSGRRLLVRSSTRFLPFLHSSAMVVTVSGSGESCSLLGARISGSCMSTCLKPLLGLSPDFTQESPFMSVFVSDGYCNRATQTWFKTTRTYYYSSQDPYVRRNQFHKSKVRVSAGLVPSRGSRGESISLPFPASRVCLNSLTRGPFLHPQSISLQPLILSSHLLLPPLTFLPPSYRTLVVTFLDPPR